MKKYLYALLLAPSIASAYQAEVTPVFAKVDSDSNIKGTSYGVSLNAYLNPVELKNHPYNEADFLERASSIQIAAFETELTFPSGTELDGPNYSISTIIMSKNNNFYLDANYSSTDLTSNNGASNNIDSNGFLISPGLFIQKNTLVAIVYEKTDREVNGNSSENTLYGLAIKTVLPKVNIQASLTNDTYDEPGLEQTNRELGVLADYFINNKISVGARLDINSGDDKNSEGKTLGVSANTYINKQFGVEILYQQFNADNSSGDDSDTIALAANFRF